MILRGDRKIKVKGRTFTRCRFHIDCPTVLLNYRFRYGKTKSGPPFWSAVCGVQLLEQAEKLMSLLLGNTRTSVFDTEPTRLIVILDS